MTLKEFIENLKLLSEKYPDAHVLCPECYVIETKSTVYSDTRPILKYDKVREGQLERNEAFANMYKSSEKS